MRIYFCLLSAFFGAFAQNPPAAQPGPAARSTQDDLCTIRGQVLNAATGEPVKKANLSLSRTDLTPDVMSMPTSYSTTSDASGKFAMNDIEPGKYRLMVNRNGFVMTSYGARGPNRPGTTLSLSKGQNASEIIFRLIPHGVVTGRILDEDGEPVANVRVQLLVYRYQQGRKQLSYSAGAMSNDLGEYRAFGVAPGKYYLSAIASNQQFGMVQDRSAAPQPEEEYVPTYFPGTTEVSSAAQISVSPGANVEGINLKLSRAHTIRVKGHVSYSIPGRQRVMVYLSPQSTGMMMGMPLRPAQADAKGDFELRGVGPGAYWLTAVINEGSKTYQGRTRIDAGSSDLEGLNLIISGGVEVSGRVRWEGSDTPDLSNVRVMLQPREMMGIMFGGFSPARVDETHAFKLQDVSPGLSTVVVSGLPAGFYVKSVRSDQTDVLENGLSTDTQPAPLDVVVSPNAAQLSGTVQNHETGNNVPGATVILIPQEKERKEQHNLYRQVTSDQNGSFTFKDVVPGEYRAYAWEDLELGSYMDPDFMKPLETKGETLRLAEKDQKSLQLTMIPAEAGTAAGLSVATAR